MMISFSERGPLSGEEFENAEVEGQKEARSPSRTFANAQNDSLNVGRGEVCPSGRRRLTTSSRN